MTAATDRAVPAPAMRMINAIVLAYGWRRNTIAFVSGAVSALAMAPIDAWPLLFLTFPVLVWLVDGAGAGRFGGALSAAVVGWWFGFGYFLAGLYWIGHAFLVDAGTFGWLLPFAVVALPAGLAAFPALGVAAARALWSRGALRLLALAIGLTAAEWLRGHVLSGFPWNAIGYALTGPLVLAQGAALIGIWGLTFAAVAIFASPAVLADDRADTPRPWLAPSIAAAMLAALTAYGSLRLAAHPTEFVDGVRMRLMQPNLQQDEKFNYDARQKVVSRYLALSDRGAEPQAKQQGSGLRDITHLIWPESAFPFFLTREPEALAQIASLLPRNTTLITGGVRPPEPTLGAATTRAYNSIYVIESDGSIASVYDKVHLVPFGEFLPFQDFLERRGLRQLTKLPGGFIAGDRRRLMEATPAPAFVPLICYEAIFPGAIVPAGERPGWMLNLTNDGWFGISSGPYQHLQQARVRAIEEGLPLVRVANTGVSAIVDPLGRIVASLPLGREGVLDGSLPQRVAPTFYVRVRDGAVALMMVVSIATIVRRRRKIR